MTPTLRSVTAAAASVVLLAGAVAACSRTVEGTAITAGSPDSTAETRIAPPSTRSSTPRSTPGRTPSAEPPGDVLSMTCEQYNDLDAAGKNAAIKAILEQEGSVLGPENVDIAKGLTDAACQFLPEVTVSEILLGTPPP